MCAESQDIIPLFDDLLPHGRGLLVMLRAYLDLGAKSDSEDAVVCVASVIFKRTPYKQFVRPWNRMLKRWGASAFHATDFYPGCQEFKRDTPERQKLFEEDSRRIPSMIGDHVHRIAVVAFRPREFAELASAEWKATYGDSVNSHATQLCLLSNGYWRKRKCPHEAFAYVVESGSPDEGIVTETVARMRHKEHPMSEVVGVHSFTTVDKGAARGLEASDFVAWQWNKHYMDKSRKGIPHNPRKDFKALADIVGDEKFEYLFMTKDKLLELFTLNSI